MRLRVRERVTQRDRSNAENELEKGLLDALSFFSQNVNDLAPLQLFTCGKICHISMHSEQENEVIHELHDNVGNF